MSDTPETGPGPASEPVDEERNGRRGFLIGLGRWSKIVIGAAVFGGLALPQADAEAGWFNRRGGWINRRGGRGGGWINRNGGGGWANRRGGGSGGSWINRR